MPNPNIKEKLYFTYISRCYIKQIHYVPSADYRLTYYTSVNVLTQQVESHNTNRPGHAKVVCVQIVVRHVAIFFLPCQLHLKHSI